MEDGRGEFLMQPLRTEMVKRSTLLPIVKQKAPRDKLGFITGLRPFFMAGDVTLEYALEQWSSRGGPIGRQADMYLKRLERGQ